MPKPTAIWNRRNINRGTTERIACTVIGPTTAGRVEIVAYYKTYDVTRYVKVEKLEVRHA